MNGWRSHRAVKPRFRVGSERTDRTRRLAVNAVTAVLLTNTIYIYASSQSPGGSRFTQMPSSLGTTPSSSWGLPRRSQARWDMTSLSVGSGSAPGPPHCWTCSEYLHREASGGGFLITATTAGSFPGRRTASYCNKNLSTFVLFHTDE